MNGKRYVSGGKGFAFSLRRRPQEKPPGRKKLFYLGASVAVVGALLVALSAVGQGQPQPQRPNIVIIWGDDIGLSDIRTLQAGGK